MKILRLLNKKNLPIIFFLILICFDAKTEDKPVDIWNIDKKEIEKKKLDDNQILNQNINNQSTQTSIYEMQSQKQIETIKLDQNLNSSEVKLLGLYDPEEYDLDINMWMNSDGDQLKNIFSKLNKINFSDDAAEIMNISILTNAYYPNNNISENEFLKFKTDWLIKNSNLDLIKEYLTKNQALDIQPELTKYFLDEYLSSYEIEKACEIFSKNLNPINNKYLSKYEIYCLIKSNKKDEAQIIFDLKKELGFKDDYFEKKINYLFEYTDEIDETISEKTILDFHLAHLTNPNFKFEPKESTSKIIWKYLASSNLLTSFKEVDISDLEKISTIEKAVHNKNYPERDLFNLYKRFQFDINQLLNAKVNYKSLSSIEARALIYQKILLESEMIEKLKLLKILKELFKKDEINEAFDEELKKYLKEMDPLEIPDTLTSFYYTNIQIINKEEKKIKFNNDIIHQSKLINYFNGDYSKSKITKDINNFLKKIKKNKKYFLSKKDIILIESLRSDGIEIEKKYDDLYEINTSEIPTDIQVMINNKEKGAALLRIAEVIGQDKLERIDEDTIYFIITTLNQLNIDFIRNKILLKVLPLKV
tara:strand:- start:167 stop:1939 length:1773 start_codon:yes stop_codon:yes gene_type:complete